MNKLFKNRSGQSTMEYIMIFVLVVFVVLGGLAAFGGQMNTSLSSQTDNLKQETNNALCVQYTDNAKPTWDNTKPAPTPTNAVLATGASCK